MHVDCLLSVAMFVGVFSRPLCKLLAKCSSNIVGKARHTFTFKLGTDKHLESQASCYWEGRGLLNQLEMQSLPLSYVCNMSLLCIVQMR